MSIAKQGKEGFFWCLFGLVSEKAEVCTVLSSFKGNCLSAFLVFGLLLFLVVVSVLEMIRKSACLEY